VVYDTGEQTEIQPGHAGEITSNAVKARGVAGVVTTADARDSKKIAEIEFPCFARFCSCIEAGSRICMVELNQPVWLGGSLSSQVRVNPGRHDLWRRRWRHRDPAGDRRRGPGRGEEIGVQGIPGTATTSGLVFSPLDEVVRRYGVFLIPKAGHSPQGLLPKGPRPHAHHRFPSLREG